jgi:CheY-like chemotaxis protein
VKRRLLNILKDDEMMPIEPVSVLLVDDDPHTGAIFELLMQHYQYPFSIVQNAEAALAYLEAHSPDVILIDLFLPGIDGFQTLNQIRSVIKPSTCRIFATTDYYTNDTKREIMQHGFDGYIPKPFVPDSFIAYLGGTRE